MVPQAGPINETGGPASAPTQALAQQLVDHIQGAEKRNKENAAATGVMLTDQQAKEALVAEVAAMIKAVVPNPQSAPHKGHKEADTGEGEGAPAKGSTPPAGRKY